jgi:hypothetical protein
MTIHIRRREFIVAPGKAVLAVALLVAVVTRADDAFANGSASWVMASVATNRLILAQADAPKSEAILRKTIADLQEGRPDFGTMESELQNAVKEQAQHTAGIYRRLGALQSLKYIGAQGGNDIYRAVYQNAAVTYSIRLSPSGKISLLLLQPAFPWE